MKTPLGRFAAASLPVLAVGCAAPERAPEPMPGAYAPVSVTDPGVVAAAAHALDAQRAAMRVAGDPATLELAGLRSAAWQVVAGVNYRLEMTVRRAGTEQGATADVWWQAWRQPDPYRLTRWTWH